MLQAVEHEAQAKGMPYWRVDNLPLQSPDLWWDRVHLGSQGSIIYSQWLGNRMATGVQHGEIQDPADRLPVNRP